jgi:hypothetical protein
VNDLFLFFYFPYPKFTFSFLILLFLIQFSIAHTLNFCFHMFFYIYMILYSFFYTVVSNLKRKIVIMYFKKICIFFPITQLSVDARLEPSHSRYVYIGVTLRIYSSCKKSRTRLKTLSN